MLVCDHFKKLLGFHCTNGVDGGGGKEADILVKYVATTKNYIPECKQLLSCKSSVSPVSLIIEIHVDPSGRISESIPIRLVMGVLKLKRRAGGGKQRLAAASALSGTRACELFHVHA